MAVLGNSSAQADDEVSDLAVHLDAVASIVLPFATVNISITNNGRDPLQSATVTLHADRPMYSGNTPCTIDSPNSTLTCQFGTLPVGATATTSSVVTFSMNSGQRGDRVQLSTTRTASTPTDPDPTNDTATETCRWTPPLSLLQPGRLSC